MRHLAPACILPLASALFIGCGSKTDPDTATGSAPDIEEVWSDCDPIAPTACGYPFPSTFYMREDASTPTGWRIAMGPTTLPITLSCLYVHACCCGLVC